MNMSYEFEMPWPPSINGYWRAVQGRQIISKRGREYRAAAIKHLDEIGLSGEMLESNVSVSLVLNPPTLRRYDVDNFNKALFDSLSEASFWVDDEQVQKLTVAKGEKVKGGNVKVKIELI
jgi:crossover junction endodeoxyribonuclease RusA